MKLLETYDIYEMYWDVDLNRYRIMDSETGELIVDLDEQGRMMCPLWVGGNFDILNAVYFFIDCIVWG